MEEGVSRAFAMLIAFGFCYAAWWLAAEARARMKAGDRRMVVVVAVCVVGVAWLASEGAGRAVCDDAGDRLFGGCVEFAEDTPAEANHRESSDESFWYLLTLLGVPAAVGLFQRRPGAITDLGALSIDFRDAEGRVWRVSEDPPGEIIGRAAAPDAQLVFRSGRETLISHTVPAKWYLLSAEGFEHYLREATAAPEAERAAAAGARTSTG